MVKDCLVKYGLSYRFGNPSAACWGAVAGGIMLCKSFKKISGAVVMLAGLLLALPVEAAIVTVTPERAGQHILFINVSGEIVSGDAERLQQALRQAAGKGQIAIMLDSRGGDVDVSMAMGQAIRAAGAVTYHGYCASACVYAFLGGVTRYLAPDDGVAMLNIHRPEAAEAHVARPNPFTAQMLSLLENYIVSMIGNSSFYQMMMQVPFATPRALQPAEAINLQVATVQLP